MRYVVGESLNRVYKNFQIVNDLDSVVGLLKKDDILVLHDTKGKTIDIGIFLSEATSKGVRMIVYINKNPNEMIASAIKANNGIVETDEEFLDEDSLEYIISEYEDIAESNELVKNDGIDFLMDFIEAFINGEDKVNNTMYQGRVQVAMKEVARRAEKNDLTLNSISTLALDLFNDIQSSFSEQKALRQKLSDKVTELKQSLTSQRSVNTNLGSNSVYLFPTVRYNGTKAIFHVKEIVECKYLQSFLMGYMNYLEIVKHKKVKMVICCQSFKNVISRYNCYSNINRSNVKVKQLLDSRILVTQEPKKDILIPIIDRSSDVVIVYDKTYGENIIEGQRVKRLYSINGVNSMKRFLLKPQNCIMSGKTIPNLFIGIPRIEKYPIDEETRKQAYLGACIEDYKKLDNLLEV